jgi:hypothetical protein
MVQVVMKNRQQNQRQLFYETTGFGMAMKNS